MPNPSESSRYNRFEAFTLDELHTLATALGNAVKSIQKQDNHLGEYTDHTRVYLRICQMDNERLLKELNTGITSKIKEAYES